MSVLVLDPNTAAAQRLHRQLEDLDFNPVVVTEAQQVLPLCQKGNVQAVLAAKATDFSALGPLPAGVAAILISHEQPDLQDLLACLPYGLNDCWQLPITDDELHARLQTVLQRMDEWIVDANAQWQALRQDLERDQRAGQYIQMDMLPPTPQTIGSCRLEHRLEPSLFLSGDFVDYFAVSKDRFACYVADVSGHGASSAFVTVLLKNFSQRLRRDLADGRLASPGEVLAWMNQELLEQHIDKHVAIFFALVDGAAAQLHYASAAHFPPAILVPAQPANASDGALMLEQKGKPLGLFADAVFDSACVDFPTGARLVVFSDGVLDLIDGATLSQKEANLRAAVAGCAEMDGLWDSFDLAKLGLDDVSCLMVSRGEQV